MLRQIARYLPHHRSENASKTHPKSSHDKFKTASYPGREVTGKAKPENERAPDRIAQPVGE